MRARTGGDGGRRGATKATQTLIALSRGRGDAKLRARGGDRVCARGRVCVCVVLCVLCVVYGDVVVVVVVVVVCVLTRLFAYVYVIGHARDEATSG